MGRNSEPYDTIVAVVEGTPFGENSPVIRRFILDGDKNREV